MKKRVLVVDDDDAIRDSLQKILETAGYEVVLAADGVEAVRRLGTKGIDLLLIDLNLPLKSRWDTYEYLTDRYPTLPIIVMTGLANAEEIDLAVGVGAVMEKPIEAVVLFDTMEELMAETNEVRLERVQRGEAARYIPSSGTQLIRKLRERAKTPVRCIHPAHGYSGMRLEVK